MRTNDPTLYLACSPKQSARLADMIWAHDSMCPILYLHSAGDVSSARPRAHDRLIAFNTGLIIPTALLKAFTLPSVNFHAASPEFPGRDPHHWAIYKQATQYGVTAHIMTEKVDDGPILAVDWFPIDPASTPQQLREAATEAMFALFQRMLPFASQRITPHRWGIKSSRAKTLAMTDLSNCDAAESALRRRAFVGFFHHEDEAALPR